MKKKVIFIILFAFYSLGVQGQGVTQSAEGKSSVILDGSAISIDIVEAELGFGWNNLNRLAVEKNNEWFGGGEIRVKNSKGLGKLFSSGDLVPEGRLNGYVGYFWSNALGATNTNPSVGNDAIPNSFEEDKKRIIYLYYDSLLVVMGKLSTLIPIQDAAGSPIRANELTKVSKDFVSFINGGNILERFHTTPLGINETEAGIPIEVTNFRTKLKVALKRVYENLTKNRLEELRRKEFVNAKQSLKSNYWRFLLFGFGGANAIGFKQFKQLDNGNLENSFEDVDDKGGQIGIGANYEWRRWRLGATYAYVSKNNFNSLTGGTYVLRTENVSGNATLISEEEITAYSGTFGEVVQNEFNLDIIYNLPLDVNRKSHLLLNPYLRGNWFSRNKSLLVNTTNLGLGFHFFKNNGNFLGGFYFELPDIQNNREKSKDIENQKLRPALQRFALGITTKISLNSVLSW